jgi:hypothetical protein
MPEHTRINKAILTGTFALSLIAVGGAYAEHRDIQDPQVRDSELSGGFYDDGQTVDNWFYDFYEFPKDRTDARLHDPARVRETPSMSRSEMDRLADAAHPLQASHGFVRPSTADTAYSRYYDEPWFYEQRDPAYTMPMTTATSESFRPAARDEEYVKGTIQAVKQVRNRQSGGQDTVALIGLNDGRKVIADLGPTQGTLHFAFTQGDSIKVGGQRENIGPYSVLMAHDIQSGANRLRLNRDTTWREADYRQVDGRIDRFRDIPVRPSGQLHRTAAVRTDDGRFTIVDMGPSPAENVPANAAPGDRITASGQVVHVGNYPVLLADRMSINNGLPVRVVRSDSEYVEPTRRPFEASQPQSATDPTCVGGGCESGTVGRSTPRNPLSNDMSGDIGSERR